MIVLSNAFSCSMQGSNHAVIRPIPAHDAEAILKAADGYASCVGHEDIARIIANDLKTKVPVDRNSVRLHPGDHVIIAQYVGKRLETGATELPVGAKITYYHATIYAVA